VSEQPRRATDPGLAPERTALAWSRTGLALLGLPVAVAAYARQDVWLSSTAAGLAAVLGLAVLVTSLRRDRATPEAMAHGHSVLAGELVLVTAAAVLLLSLACLVLVLE
jgi:uncharacterized membrane protein YidH (DUF202 family)